jgi:hypothetical protein
MILHLEYGNCESGISTADLNCWAANCYQWKQFINPERRDYLLDIDNWNEDEDEDEAYPFFCPGCNGEFEYLSALFQHVTTQSCNQSLDIYPLNKLCRWLEVGNL